MKCIELGFIIHTDEDVKKYIVDVMYTYVKKIFLMDNLNTHYQASFYKRYLAYEARRIIKCLEIHYTYSMEVALISQK